MKGFSRKIGYVILSVLMIFGLCAGTGNLALAAEVAVGGDGAGREWEFRNVGSGAKGSMTQNDDGSITIDSTGGKIADSEDGFSFYYTKLDARTENFTLTAKFTVTGGTWNNTTYGDNQSGFGVIATDMLPTAGGDSDRYFNSASAAVAKYVNKDLGKTAYRVPGGKLVTGYTDPMGMTGSDADNVRNMDNKTPFDWDADQNLELGDSYTLTLRKSNTGYHAILNNDTDSQIIFWGPEALMVQDEDYIYAGFFAGRKIEITVSDMNLTVISPEDDEPALDKPLQEVVPDTSINTPSTLGVTDFPFEFTSNVSGSLTVKDEAQTVLIDGKAVTAQEFVNDTFLLSKGTNQFEVTYMPDPDQFEGTDKTLSSTDPIIKTISVTYREFTGDKIYVSVSGTEKGDGSRENPLDVYTAIAYVKPGQTVVMTEGVYQPSKVLKAERGHNGTGENMITWTVEEGADVVLDLSANSSGGVNLSGNYWHFYGMEICKAPYGVKPFHVQGSNNIVEMTSIHDNGDSGLQISGSADESFSKWPANNLIKNCESYNNCDKTANDADGFAAKLTCGEGNVFDGCISHHNIDDGWDLYAKSTTGSIGAVTVKNCVTYSNGYLQAPFLADPALNIENLRGEGNGFKLGGESMPGGHILENSISFNNYAKGITSNSCPDDIILNSTSFNNCTQGGADLENVALYTNAKTTNYQVSGLISSMTLEGLADKRELKGQDTLDSASNYFFDGTKSVNANGTIFDPETMFVSTDVTIIPTLTEDGVDMHGLLQLNENAPKNAGATLLNTVSQPIKITYQAHVQNKGWMTEVSDGAEAGTEGEALRMEALKIKVENSDLSGNVEYQAHVQNIGWQDSWCSDGELAGTEGKGLRMEAFRIRLTGQLAEEYDVYYQTHVEDAGWLDWAKNGEDAGSLGLSLRVEAIRICLVEKGGQAPGAVENPFVDNTYMPDLVYQVHMEHYGWGNEMKNGELAGTVGESKRLEALKLRVNDSLLNGSIEYQTHVQDYGWEDGWKKDFELSGTSGEAKRLEAVRIRLTDRLGKLFDIEYRVHVQNVGWQDWMSNGEEAGTVGMGRRLEGIEIRLVRK